MKRLFDFCWMWLMSIASLLKVSYRTVSVFLCNDLGNSAVVLSIIIIVCHFVPNSRTAQMFCFWAVILVIALTLVLLYFGLKRLLLEPELIEPNVLPDDDCFDDKSRINIVFKQTMNDLQWLAKKLHISYGAINIIVYCILYPIIVICGLVVPWI